MVGCSTKHCVYVSNWDRNTSSQWIWNNFLFMFFTWSHSHKKRKDKIWNLPSGSKHRGSLSLKEISFLEVIFVLIEMNQTLIWFNLQRDETGNGLSNIKDTFPERLQLQISVLYQNMCIFKTGLSKVHMMAGQNIKKKYLRCQLSIKMLKQHATPCNSSLDNLKIYSSKRCIKTTEGWIILAKTQQFYKYSNIQQKISL